ALCKDHLPFRSHAAQHALEPAQDQGLIVHKQDAPGHAAFLSVIAAPATGKRMINTVPFPISLSKRIVPWCLSTTTECEIAKPWPVPFPTPLVVKNGSKILLRIFSGMPPPVSPILTSTHSPQFRVSTVITPFPLPPSPTTSAMACVALII